MPVRHDTTAKPSFTAASLPPAAGYDDGTIVAVGSSVYINVSSQAWLPLSAGGAFLEFELGHPDGPYMPRTDVPIVGSRAFATISGGPYKLAAGESITVSPHIVRGTTSATVSMNAGDSELYVTNAAGSQRLAVENDDVADLLAVLDAPIPLSGIDQQDGTDLSIVGGNAIKSTAGGMFWAVACIAIEIS